MSSTPRKYLADLGRQTPPSTSDSTSATETDTPESPKNLLAPVTALGPDLGPHMSNYAEFEEKAKSRTALLTHLSLGQDRERQITSGLGHLDDEDEETTIKKEYEYDEASALASLEEAKMKYPDPITDELAPHYLEDHLAENPPSFEGYDLVHVPEDDEPENEGMASRDLEGDDLSRSTLSDQSNLDDLEEEHSGDGKEGEEFEETPENQSYLGNTPTPPLDQSLPSTSMDAARVYPGIFTEKGPHQRVLDPKYHSIPLTVPGMATLNYQRSIIPAFQAIAEEINKIYPGLIRQATQDGDTSGLWLVRKSYFGKLSSSNASVAASHSKTQQKEPPRDPGNIPGDTQQGPSAPQDPPTPFKKTKSPSDNVPSHTAPRSNPSVRGSSMQIEATKNTPAGKAPSPVPNSRAKALITNFPKNWRIDSFFGDHQTFNLKELFGSIENFIQSGGSDTSTIFEAFSLVLLLTGREHEMTGVWNEKSLTPS